MVKLSKENRNRIHFSTNMKLRVILNAKYIQRKVYSYLYSIMYMYTCILVLPGTDKIHAKIHIKKKISNKKDILIYEKEFKNGEMYGYK